MIDITKLNDIITCKWPQCVIVGKKLTKEQAQEVLIKTDLFFTSSYSCGNDDKFEQELRKRLNMPPMNDWNSAREEYERIYNENQSWKSEHKVLDLNYLTNNWISSCYVGGPNGWCHVDGTIHSTKNIGKWPNWNEIVEDLEQLGNEFPFLDITVYIINCEDLCGWDDDEKDQRVCIGGIHLCNGKLEIVDPIDPFSDICRPSKNYCWEGLPKKLRDEVAAVVTPVTASTFQSQCPNEQIFKMEEAVEYFGII